jgi:predicted Rossmann-fold nucleotide-binding protein
VVGRLLTVVGTVLRMGSRAVYVAIVGAGDADDDTSRIAEEVGRRVARAGAIVVCGGLGGVMEAACRGATENGGTTVGILPGAPLLQYEQFGNAVSRRNEPVASYDGTRTVMFGRRVAPQSSTPSPRP